MVVPTQLPVADHRMAYRLRTQVAIDGALRAEPIDLVLPYHPAAVELRADGQVVPPAAAVAGGAYRRTLPHRFPLPEAVTEDGEVELELTVRHRWTQSGWFEATPRLMPRDAVSADLRAATILHRVVPAFATSACVFLACVYFLGWLLDRRRRAHAWFALEVGAASIYPLHVAGWSQTLFGVYDTAVAGGTLAIAGYAALRFTLDYFRRPPPHWLWTVPVAAILGVSVVCGGPFLATAWVGTPVVAFLAVMIGYTLYICIQERRRADRPLGSTFWFVGWSIAATSYSNEFMLWTGQLPFLEGLRPATLGIAVLPVVQAFLLSHEYITSLNATDRLNATLAERVRELEEQRRDQAEMQMQLTVSSRLAAVGTLAAGTAHEINNPLTYIVANVDAARDGLAQAQLPKEPQGELEGLLDEAAMGCRRVGAIVRDLMRLARSEGPTGTPTNVVRVIESCIRMAGNEIRHRASVVRDYPGEMHVLGDETRLSQVFLNLLVNAAHAIPEGQARRNQIRISISAGEEVRIDVADTGRGIDAATLERIFDPFFTTKRQGRGLGLGLSISHSIVESLGGRLEAQSELGKGTTFSMWLPRAEPVSSDDDDTTQIVAKVPPAKVLVVDDEPAVARALRRLLRGHEVTLAASGREALTLCEQESFDIVLCDMMMPDLTGADVYHAVRKSNPELAARIAFVTGGAFTETAKAFLESVPNPVLQKPVEKGALRKLIREHGKPALPIEAVASPSSPSRSRAPC
ncbi:MAG: ATP-binding protein [Myxococcota bacterium]